MITLQMFNCSMLQNIHMNCEKTDLFSWLWLLSPGLLVKVCLYDESGIPTGSTENRTLYSDEDFSNFLMRRGWQGFREMGTFRDIYSIEDMHPGAVYQRAP